MSGDREESRWGEVEVERGLDGELRARSTAINRIDVMCCAASPNV